jgi:predicted TIM-barrel fold metal-dependent hydrolase
VTYDADSAELAVRMARQINDAFARVVRERKKRFTALATLPLNDPEASVVELERAMKDLGLPGAMVFSNVNHVALADERFAPLWKKADDLGAVIYIHPTDPDRILAGSDYPHQIGSILLMLETIEKLDLRSDVEEKILGGNAAALLGL